MRGRSMVNACEWRGTGASRTAPAVVNLWAPWCGPCREEMPRLERVARKNPG